MGGAAAASPGPSHALVVRDVTLISPERAEPLTHADVLIREGRIAAIGAHLDLPGAQTVDGRGRFLVPGLIDSHVHVNTLVGLDEDAIASHPELAAAYRAQVPRSFLAFGFTTLVDLDLSPGTREWFDAAPLHPRLYGSGPGVRVAGGYGAVRLPADARPDQVPNLVYESTQAKYWPATLDPRDYSPQRAVERAVAAGAICVKVFVEPGFSGVFDWPVPSRATLAALHAAAAARHLPMIVHANGVDAWHAALEAHAEILAHGLWQWPGERTDSVPPATAGEVIREAARQRVWVQPTLQTVYGERSVFDAGILDDPRFALAVPRSLIAYLHSDTARAARQAVADAYGQIVPGAARVIGVGGARASATLRMMHAAGVRLLFGSDTPPGEGIGNPPGLNGRWELGRWADAGIPPAQILRAATLDNAAAFGLARELGSIEVGKRADLLLLSANPLESVAAYDSIETIIVNGQIVRPADLRPAD